MDSLNQFQYAPTASSPYPLHPNSSILEASRIVSKAEVPPIENEKSSVKENCLTEPPNNTDVPIDAATTMANKQTARIMYRGFIR